MTDLMKNTVKRLWWHLGTCFSAGVHALVAVLHDNQLRSSFIHYKTLLAVGGEGKVGQAG